MVAGRGPLLSVVTSKVTASLFFVSFLIYLVMMNRLEMGQFGRVPDPSSFSSRMLMNHPASSSSSGDNIRETISNSGVIGAIDNMVHQIGAAGTDLTESRVKHISEEIAKQIADYVVQRLGAQTSVNNNVCSGCWKSRNSTGNSYDV